MLARDIELHASMPEGEGKEALASAINVQAHRISARASRTWQVDQTQYRLLLAASFTLSGLALRELAEASRDTDAVSEVMYWLGVAALTYGVITLVLNAAVVVLEWLGSRGDEQVAHATAGTARLFKALLLYPKRHREDQDAS